MPFVTFTTVFIAKLTGKDREDVRPLAAYTSSRRQVMKVI